MPGPKHVEDRDWRGDARAAAGIAVLFPGLLVAVDAASGCTHWQRVLLWTALGLTLFAVLWPTRVRAAPGLLTTRGLLHRRRVHTDRLVSVAWHDGVAQRLVLRDLDGNRLDVDPRVFAANPALWHLFEQGVRASLSLGTVTEGSDPLRRLSRLIDRQTVTTVFKLSGLDHR
ncbi:MULTISPECIES: hypothetical protein [unclassified Streptomyces]|uniref:hypothetical protein n=1 Tax=unclassified Streptomyces TaxID=2593676 RepID=UPI00331F87C4